ncbi:hypothetical protein UA08_09468 [Talaromyces atroroseus]|uniref:3'-5' exonuclease domain-containing protein n=1 Tax=Talaromyces atroroseus TaxID=1441469 RepID=A0A1Q5Q6C7_TALAT|nr:hypothetical protein UA08_09468 [Talaromyces atroroseus]OKL55250.1 hypothetical protein UA08_09468 [Talaromyces atroroseus]
MSLSPLRVRGHSADVNIKTSTTSSQASTEVRDAEILGLTTTLVGTSLQDKTSPIIISTTTGINELIETIDALATHPPSLYVDLEGVNLSRNGTISILQIYIMPCDTTYLIDVYVLKKDAFTYRTPLGRNLKEIFETPSIPKVFFDVRNDSDALYSHFGIRLAGVQDLQLMELATRSFSKRRVNGLARCIEHDASMTTAEIREWSVAKEKGKNLFAPERGGSYEVFNVRPLTTEIVQYCIQDVRFLPTLWRNYNGKLRGHWKSKVEIEVQNRIKLSQSRDYNGKGPHMALAPRGWK